VVDVTLLVIPALPEGLNRVLRAEVSFSFVFDFRIHLERSVGSDEVDGPQREEAVRFSRHEGERAIIQGSFDFAGKGPEFIRVKRGTSHAGLEGGLDKGDKALI
jgi:hypothetical protein